MGYMDFLTAGSRTSPPSLGTSLELLEDASTLFVAAWTKTPQNMEQAHRSSQTGLTHLDHIANQILRARDGMRANSSYAGSPLEAQLLTPQAESVSPVTVGEQDNLVALGPGAGSLPRPGAQVTFERLLNKIKHRRPDAANFRIGSNSEHFLLLAVNTPQHQPESIVEFCVGDFCTQLKTIVPLV